jgi:rhodanese-related sulfurtransferase
MDEYTQFFLTHWVLSCAFIGLLLLLIVNEVLNKLQGTKLLSAQDVTLLINQEQAVLVDLRSSQAFSEGHIIHALNFPLDKLTANMDKLNQSKTKNIILICKNGQTSITATKLLQKHGFANIAVLRDGIQGWQQAKLPLITGKKG